jgi:hypothetical protein
MLYLYFSPPSYNDVANNGQGGKSDGSSNVWKWKWNFSQTESRVFNLF